MDGEHQNRWLEAKQYAYEWASDAQHMAIAELGQDIDHTVRDTCIDMAHMWAAVSQAFRPVIP
jgi:hypothetical protein